MNRDSFYLFLLILVLLLVSFVDNLFLLSSFLFAIVVAYLGLGGSLQTLLKTIRRIAAFCIVLSVAYWIHAILNNTDPLRYILLFNLRIMDMIISVLCFREFANPVHAFSFSRTLSYMFTLTYSQIQVYMSLYEDFKFVRRSRMVHTGGYSHRLSFFAKMVEYFFKKAIARSENTAMAMRARGFFLHD